MARGKDERDLQRYFDGELGRRRSQKVRDRLEGDATARGQLHALESMRGMLRQATEGSVDDADFGGLWARVRSGVERDLPLGLGERLGLWLRRWGIAMAGAAAAAAVLLVVLVQPGEGPPARNDAVIESLDVGPEAVSTIFTIADPGEDMGETTVIWVTETSAEGDE